MRLNSPQRRVIGQTPLTQSRLTRNKAIVADVHQIRSLGPNQIPTCLPAPSNVPTPRIVKLAAAMK